MKKYFSWGLTVLVVIILSSCSKDVKTLDVILNTYTSSYMENLENVYHHINDAVIINSYDDYNKYLIDDEIAGDDTYLERDFFNENVIIIIPVYTSKNPDFEIKDFNLTENFLEIEIIQVNSLIRTNITNYDENYFTLELSINTTELDSVDVSVIEENLYFDFRSFVSLDASAVFGQEEMIILKDFASFESTVQELEFYGYELFEYEEMYSSDIFDNHILIILRKESASGDYTSPIDVQIINVDYDNDVRQYLFISASIVGTMPTFSDWDIISFVLINKEFIDGDLFSISTHYVR